MDPEVVLFSFFRSALLFQYSCLQRTEPFTKQWEGGRNMVFLSAGLFQLGGPSLLKGAGSLQMALKGAL